MNKFLYYHLYLSNIDIVKLHGKQIPPGLSSNEWQWAIFDTCTAFENKFEQIKSNISFKLAPKDSKKKSKKKAKSRSTDLTKVASYLARNNITNKEQVQQRIDSLPLEIKNYDKIMQFYTKGKK